MAPHADESQEGKNGHGSGSGHSDRNVPKPGEYIQFECLPPGGPLNRWSQVMTREHDFPGAQVSTSPFVDPRRMTTTHNSRDWAHLHLGAGVVPGASGGREGGGWHRVFVNRLRLRGVRGILHGVWTGWRRMS